MEHAETFDAWLVKLGSRAPDERDQLTHPLRILYKAKHCSTYSIKLLLGIDPWPEDRRTDTGTGTGTDEVNKPVSNGHDNTGTTPPKADPEADEETQNEVEGGCWRQLKRSSTSFCCAAGLCPARSPPASSIVGGRRLRPRSSSQITWLSTGLAVPNPDAWWDETWNPIGGCSMVSPGCVNCYAAREAATRQTATEIALYDGVAERWRGGHRFTGHMTELHPAPLAGLGRSIGKVRRIRSWAGSAVFDLCRHDDGPISRRPAHGDH